MSEWIRREDALDAIQKRADEVDSVYSAFWEGLKIAQDIVEKVPSAEPERKKGKWIHDGSQWANRWICSECEYKWFHSKEEAHFCPNCGSKMMRGEDGKA